MSVRQAPEYFVVEQDVFEQSWRPWQVVLERPECYKPKVLKNAWIILRLEGTPTDPWVVLKCSQVVPKRPRVLLLKVFNNTRVILMKNHMENVIRRIAFHMESSPWALGRIADSSWGSIWSSANLIPKNPEKKPKDTWHGAPEPWVEYFSLELKGHLDCRMCPEWDLDLM
jgi:hypothetical protein